MVLFKSLGLELVFIQQGHVQIKRDKRFLFQIDAVILNILLIK